MILVISPFRFKGGGGRSSSSMLFLLLLLLLQFPLPPLRSPKGGTGWNSPDGLCGNSDGVSDGWTEKMAVERTEVVRVEEAVTEPPRG